MNRQTQSSGIHFSGTPLAQGISSGNAFILRHINLSALSDRKIPSDDTEFELSRFNSSINTSIQQLTDILDRIDVQNETAKIFNVQLTLLNDNVFIDSIRDSITENRANCEFIVANCIKKIELQFLALENEIARTRFLDIQDVYHRLLRNLLNIEHVRVNPLHRTKDAVVLIAQKLLPSDIALLEFNKIAGAVIEVGNSVSHVALVIKSLGIPAVINVPGVCARVRNGDTVIIDGTNGEVIVNPSSATIELYETTRKNLDNKKIIPACISNACHTVDNTHIRLEANIGSIGEAQTALTNGAEGIGLLRSEFYYMSNPTLPCVDKESAFYESISTLYKGMPLTIRLLDLGGDKVLPYPIPFSYDPTPLGVRGIRWLLKNPTLLRSHILSIVKASRITPLKILIPFVTTFGDLRKVTDVIDEVTEDNGLDRSKISVGVQAEVPSVALCPGPLIKNSAFITVGTNDLIQYLFAADRENSEVQHYAQSFHPLLLNIIKNIVDSAAKENREVTLCGELVAESRGACLLVGLGVRVLSMQPEALPKIRKTLSRFAMKELQEIASRALLCETQEQVEEMVAFIVSDDKKLVVG